MLTPGRVSRANLSGYWLLVLARLTSADNVESNKSVMESNSIEAIYRITFSTVPAFGSQQSSFKVRPVCFWFFWIGRFDKGPPTCKLTLCLSMEFLEGMIALK
uniref:Secreted protein n=1 Tax=Steinernema glaseri TaxID=37863 RepID=A0A1I8ASF8_9BILA